MSVMMSGGSMNWTVTTNSSTGNWFNPFTAATRVFVNDVYNPLVPDEMRKAVVPSPVPDEGRKAVLPGSNAVTLTFIRSNPGHLVDKTINVIYGIRTSNLRSKDKEEQEK